MVSDDWYADHPEYDGPDDPKELADIVPADELKKRILEATAADQTSIWSFRRDKFIRWLNTWERIWFD